MQTPRPTLHELPAHDASVPGEGRAGGPGALHRGDLVRLRGRRWRVDATQAFTDCRLIRLVHVGPPAPGRRLAVLWPFDRPQPVEVSSRMRRVSRRRWVHAFRTLAATATPFGRLRTASGARIDLHAYQLEPALAVLNGFATRLLLADEVGLGKTIQAGLLAAELLARDQAARTLILTPAGLRDQWASELRDRFSIEAVVVDAAAVRRGAGLVAAGTNPWSIWPVAIASVDFVKRPEVLRALEPFTWDLLVVDEAHGCAKAPERSAAVTALAARARRVALLTATPHAGDDQAFAALCRIGEVEKSAQNPAKAGPHINDQRLRLATNDQRLPTNDHRPTTTDHRPTTNDQRPTTNDQIVMFRRSRADVGLARDRRVHLLRVRCTAAERRMHRLLDRYTQAVWRSPDASRDARLAMIVLRKRALSSAASLARSLERRLDALFDAGSGAAQMALPFPGSAEPDEETPDDEEPVTSLGAPGLDGVRERGWLTRTLAAARAAAGRESKIDALARLLRRGREPAVVFTEYRDTARHLAGALAPLGCVVLLHGALSRAERLETERAFRTGAARILVATDAAGEGINLQHRCRLVVDLELPWNPMRLEQRIGRVDRLGQRRRPHAIHLLAAATAEERIVGRLLFRQERARRAVGFVNEVVGVRSEDEVALAVMRGGRTAAPDGPAAAANPPARFSTVDLRDAANDELRRLLFARAAGRTMPGPTCETGCPAFSVLPPRRARRRGLRPGLIAMFVVRLLDPTEGEVLEECVIALHARLVADGGERQAWREFVDCVTPVLRQRAVAEASGRLEAAARSYRQATATASARERALADARPRRLAPLQPGMFDRRALREAERADEDRRARASDQSDRLARLERQLAADPVVRADLALVLVIEGR